ncbi:hypothetical protein F5Y12DRAFT_715242 [Xylaria sp. FL1777]|nr:hypothetical protein F5Y12DRAFT_715242 [Xylaria sp. FL1777]
MDALADILGGRVTASDTAVVTGVDGERGGGLPFTSVPSKNPQATVPEGLNTAIVTAPAPTPVLSVPPAIPSSVPVAILRSSTRNHISSPLLRGPVPQKGSGQDRLRQQLLKENDYGRLTIVDQSNLFSVTPCTGTIQRLAVTPQRYSPDHSAVNPPLFTLRAATSATATSPSTQEMDRVITTPSEIKGEMLPEVRRKAKDSSLIQLLPKVGEAHSQSGRQTGGVATARLSAECQLRHFNPKWQETSGPYGFKCSVQLMNKVVHGDRAHSTAYDAKQAVAEKALVQVRRLPCEDPAQKVAARLRSGEQTDRVSDRNRPGRAAVKREPSANASHASFHGQYAYATPAGANAAAYNWNTYGYTEPRALLHRIQSLFGGAGPSPAVLSDPLAAQAFLQGLALGTSIHAASSAYEPYLEPRGRPLPAISGEIYRPYEPRERSPAPDISRNYRDRSSPRRRTSYESNSRQANSRAL